MLKPIRRHTPKCPHRKKGNDYLKCTCPLWAYGTVNRKRIRDSLQTRDLQRAYRKIGAMMEETPAKPSTTLASAAEQFISSLEVRESSLLKYRRTLRSFLALAIDRGVKNTEDVTVELIDAYRLSRAIAPITWSKELDFLRGFFSHCQARGWIAGNPAKLCRSPKLMDKAVEPYTQEEFIRMLTACDSLGQEQYERRRSRAMLLVLRHTALRISDVATLKRSSLQGDRIHVRTIKNSKEILLRVPAEVVDALQCLPNPDCSGPDAEYFFWSGYGTLSSLVRSVDRTLRKVFLKSGVTGAHAHRFRHTLATELLGDPEVSFEDVASILGSSPGIIRKHYAQWSTKRQERIDSLMQTVWSSEKDTIVTQTKKVSAIC